MTHGLHICRLMMACGLFGLCATDSHAQQREFFNGGFEANDPQGPGTPSFQIYTNPQVPEWTDQTGSIELWDSGFQGITAYEGGVFAEMNAFAPGTLYQQVCLVAGETIGWSFAHRARSGGPGINPQVALLEIADTSGNVFQQLASQSSFIGGPWNVNTGSAVYTGTTGTRRMQFRTTNPGSYGNFIDDLRLNISAFAQLDTSVASDVEGTGGNIPAVLVNGRVEVATTIPVSVTGGTATAGDFTLSAPFVTIPAGIYKDVAFPLPLSITDESASELDETIEFTLGTPSTGEIIFARVACDGGAPTTTVTYTIINDDGRLQGSKSVAPAPSEPFSTPGSDMLYTIRVENTGQIAVDGNTIFLVDALPPELDIFTGDLGGPGSGPVAFSQAGGALSFSPATDVGFAGAGPAPSTFSQCNAAPTGGYDASLRYLCITMDGTLPAGTPDPSFEVTFRMRIP